MDMSLITPGIGAVLAIMVTSFVMKSFTLGEYESDFTTENGVYRVHITRVGKRRPYMQVKIKDQTRNRNHSKTFRDQHLIQMYDEEKLDEVMGEIIKWYENTIVKKITKKGA